jgi:flavodoxin
MDSKTTKVLVAYFSHSGNTRRAAERISTIVGGELFEIRTVNTYSKDYSTVV